MPAQIKTKLFQLRRYFFFFYYVYACAYPKLSVGAESIGGQLCGDKKKVPLQ